MSFWRDGFWAPGFWSSGFWGEEAEPAVPPAPTFTGVGKRDLRKKRRAALERKDRQRKESEFFLIGM